MSRVIAVNDLGKKYIIRHQQKKAYTSLRDTMTRKAVDFGRKILNPFVPSNSSQHNNPSREEFWALKDVSFEINQGERVGIIGRNGAGKTTLLKLLSRITEPTKGRIAIKGRVASLLEVGTGFHPELTGRENIFLNGAVLGMARVDIKKRFDEIVAFAEVERFLDTPVKRYSSGMYVRLAFAVAAHLEPEILLVDEVLAVGDAKFQKKCLGKMGCIAEEGRTVLFVSHNMQAMQTLCSRAIWLQDGQIKEQGGIRFVVNEYLNKSVLQSGRKQIWEDSEKAPGNEFIKVYGARVISDKDIPEDIITIETPLRIEYVFQIFLDLDAFSVGIHFRNISGQCIFVGGITPQKIRHGIHRSTCFIPGNLLNNGTYTMEVFFARDASEVIYHVADLLVFEIHDAERAVGSFLGELPGAVRPKLRWAVDQINDLSQSLAAIKRDAHY